MASYHCTAKVVSRSRGQSAIAKAAYNARERLTDEQTGEIKNYTRKAEQVLCSFIWGPPGITDDMRDRQELWNRVEAVENRKNSQLAREIEIAIPHELSQQQREWLLKDFVRENFVRAGMIADVNMHGPHPDGDQRNVHAHILLTTRRIEGEGFAADKAREWNSKALYNEWREDLAEKGAKALERAGFEIEAERWRYGHLTNRQQQQHAIERGDMEFAQTKGREPSKHLGPEIKEILNRGLVSEVQERRGVEAVNDNALRAELLELRAERAELERRERVIANRRQPQKELSDAVGGIRTAYAISDNAGMFQEALAERGFWLARADENDIWRSKFDHGRAESNNRYAPVLEMDQIVAVDTLGRAFLLGRDATGENRGEVSAFLAQLGGEALPSVEDMRMEFKAPRIEYIYRDRENLDSQNIRGGRSIDGAVRAIEGAAAIGEAVAGKVLDTAAQEVEGALEMLGDMVAPSKPDPELAKARAAHKIERAERAEAQRVDWRRALADDEYRCQLAQREREEREQRERDEYRKKDRGRER